MSIRPLIAGAALLCLAAAGWQVTLIEPGQAFGYRAPQRPDPAAVEKSFADEVELLKSGKSTQALLSLRRRAEKGPFPGPALYLMGVEAYRQGAYSQAVEHWQKGVKLYPYLGDRDAPFGAAKRMNMALAELKSGVWAGKKRSETARMHALMRRLAGGCE